MSTINIRLLGTLQINCDGVTETQFRSRRAIALLAYLIANHNRPIPRPELVELIWPDKAEQKGRGNLRWALSYLSNILPGGLDKTRHTVQFGLDVESVVDTHIIARAMTGDNIEQLGTLILGIQGEYMAGFYFGESAEFETWLITQRETWRLRLLEYLENLITYYATVNEYEKGLAFAQKWLSIEPWSEPAYCWVMRMLSRLGQPARVREQYERCWRILAEELGTEPTDETTNLYQRLMQLADQPRHNLPAQPTEFVGRLKESAEIIRQLTSADTRLITIVGPGGMGKTRLAIKAAEELVDSFIDGVVFVDLTTIASSDNISDKILNSLIDSGIVTGQTVGNVGATRVLRQAILECELLLVLDNFEHIIDGTTHLVNLLQDVPRLKVLVTSRERLNIRWERLIDIDGLPLLTAYNLFVLTARRTRPAFVGDANNRRQIENICELVEGMPLAIELAAGWTRMQSCDQIAETIRNNLDLLTTSQRDMPDRHRSVHAVFQSSWERLPEDEQERLGMLALFTGGFSAESARAVSGASWSSLAPLVDKSLVSQSLSTDGGGALVRYKMHELLRQFSAEKLPTSVANPARDQHAAWFCQLLLKNNEAIKRADRHALDEIAREIGNIKQAWLWSIQTGAITNLTSAIEPLGYFFDMRSRWQESRECIEPAIALLRPLSSSDPMANVALISMLLSLGNTLTRLMHYEASEAMLREALAMSRALHYQPAIIFALFTLARVRGLQLDINEARALYRESLDLAKQSDDLAGQARAIVNLSSTAMSLGEWAEGGRLAEESFALFTTIKDQRGQAVALLNQAHAALVDGDFHKARTLANQAHLLSDDSGAISVIGGCKILLAEIAFQQNKLADAKAIFTQALALFSQIGEDNSVIEIWYWLGRIALLENELEKADSHAHRVMQLSDHLKWSTGQVLGDELHGRVALIQEDDALAKQHMMAALRHVQHSPFTPTTLKLLEAFLPLNKRQQNSALVSNITNALHRHVASDDFLRRSVAPVEENQDDFSLDAIINQLLQ